MPDPLDLLVHGVRARVTTSARPLLELLAFDLWSYRAGVALDDVDVHVEARVGPVPDDFIPRLVETVHAPEFVAFDGPPYRYVDYYGRAAVRYEPGAETAVFVGDDVDFLGEKVYLFLLSRIGEELDRRGLHRVHGLAFRHAGRTGLLVVPMHGGKSTLAASLLTRGDVELLGEDTPLLDRRGHVHPFVSRLGFRAGAAPVDASPERLRVYAPSRGDTKTLVRSDHLGDRLARTASPLDALFVGKWQRATDPDVHPIAPRHALLALVRDSVIGLGLPQLVEYFLLGGARDLSAKARIATRRALAATAAARRARAFELRMGTDIDATRELMLATLRDTARVR